MAIFGYGRVSTKNQTTENRAYRLRERGQLPTDGQRGLGWTMASSSCLMALHPGGARAKRYPGCDRPGAECSLPL